MKRACLFLAGLLLLAFVFANEQPFGESAGINEDASKPHTASYLKDLEE
jgi:hypothetical protein